MKIPKKITCCLLLALLIINFSFGQTTTDFEKIKQRVVTSLLKIEANDSICAELLKTIRKDGTWPGINYKDYSRTGFEHRYQTYNMLELARCYNSTTSTYYKKKELIKVIELTLKNWVENDYLCDNWWYNQIGIPHNLVELMLLVGSDINNELVSKAQKVIGRAHINAPG